MVAKKFIYHGAYNQRGQGIGALMGGLFKTLIPALTRGASSLARSPTVRRALTAAGKEAVRAGASAASQAVRGKNVRPVLKQSLERAKKRIANAALEGHCPPAKKKKKQGKKTSRTNIFGMN